MYEGGDHIANIGNIYQNANSKMQCAVGAVDKEGSHIPGYFLGLDSCLDFAVSALLAILRQAHPRKMRPLSGDVIGDVAQELTGQS